MDEMREMQMSIAALSMFPGFKFSPTDPELISYYLKKKLENSDQCVDVISEVEICKYEPWDLPAQAIIQSENEWFFFSPRGRKYPNGSQSKRATQSGYWKATGKERNVKSGSNLIGTKRTLVFHTGRAPKGLRTEWIMHEYSMKGKSQDSMVVCRLRKNNEFHLDDTSRKGSRNQRCSSAGDNRTLVSSEAGIELTPVLEGACASAAVECSSKEGSSSYNSDTVEQIDSGSVSDEKEANEFFQHDSSSRQPDYDIEEDCFADIMNDDIIKLDESSLPKAPDLPPMVVTGSEAERKSKSPMQAIMSNVFPFQGTAARRLRLVRRKERKLKAEPLKASVVGGEAVSHMSSQESPKCVLSMFSGTSVKQRAIYVFLIILTLLVLFLSLLGALWQAKRHACASLV